MQSLILDSIFPETTDVFGSREPLGRETAPMSRPGLAVTVRLFMEGNARILKIWITFYTKTNIMAHMIFQEIT